MTGVFFLAGGGEEGEEGGGRRNTGGVRIVAQYNCVLFAIDTYCNTFHDFPRDFSFKINLISVTVKERP